MLNWEKALTELITAGDKVSEVKTNVETWLKETEIDRYINHGVFFDANKLKEELKEIAGKLQEIGQEWEELSERVTHGEQE